MYSEVNEKKTRNQIRQSNIMSIISQLSQLNNQLL